MHSYTVSSMKYGIIKVKETNDNIIVAQLVDGCSNILESAAITLQDSRAIPHQVLYHHPHCGRRTFSDWVRIS